MHIANKPEVMIKSTLRASFVGEERGGSARAVGYFYSLESGSESDRDSSLV